ncbi:tyrosine-protein phosphatase [Panacagrimonas sp.]|uniref:tyrosine-protein phosphatase n=1 Tax=Panacagrimonas sp. TaxID=2480088 RepID=UPI003B5238DE
MTASAPHLPGPVDRIPLQGAINLRDLGGHPTRDGRRVAPGRLYRSDALWELSDADVERLAELGLRTVCDFRAPHECARRQNRLPARTPPRTLELGFTPQGTQENWDAINRRAIAPQGVVAYMHEHYRALATVHVEHFAQLFQGLLEADALPLLFHCASGKDRTGFAAAIVLTALDVPREHIVADYAISDRAAHRRNLDHLFGPQSDPACRAAVAAAHPDYLNAAFRAVEDGWGSTDEYLRRAMRLDEKARARLRGLLLI